MSFYGEKDRSSASLAETPQTDNGAEAASEWLAKLSYVSLMAGLISIAGFLPRESRAENEVKAPLPPRTAGKGSVSWPRKGSECSRPALLRRQSEYRFPGSKGSLNMVNLFAGSDTCPGTPIPAGTYTAASPYTDSGDTIGASNNVVNHNCFYNYYSYTNADGPDHVYSFTLTARGTSPRIEVSPTMAAYQPHIYILNGAAGMRCPTGLNRDANNCLIARDSQGFGGTETISSQEMETLPLNVPLHLFVDSAWSSGSASAGPYTIRMQDVTIANNAIPPANDAPLDMDGDGRSDFVVARNTGGQTTWYTRTSSDTFLSPVNWGMEGDIPVPANYDADGKVDYAVWRPGAQGRFYIIRSQTQTLHIDDFGQTGDDPTVVADYTGDGMADPAVYRAGATPGAPSYWYYRTFEPPMGFTAIQFGQHGDTPVPGDYYTYDTITEMALRRADGPNGVFLVRYWWGHIDSYTFGNASDTVVPGDYDNDGITDLAVARIGGDGLFVWDFDPSGTYGTSVDRSVWGVAATDVLAPGDYDGDGQMEFAVWRPGNPGTFFVKKPGTGQIRAVSWGQTGDVPVASYLVR